MNKKSYQLIHLYSPHIKVGDEVYLKDGSALTLLSDDNKETKDSYYIVNSYPICTGSTLKLEEIKATVITINIKDRVTIGSVSVYIQDIIVQIGNAQFRTCSALVRLAD